MHTVHDRDGASKAPPLPRRGRPPFLLLSHWVLLATILAAYIMAAPPALPAQAVTSASISGLHVVGNQIVNGAGQPIRLLGVNRSGAEYACIQGWGIFEGPVDAAAVQAIKAWHTNAVRVPLNEQCWLGVNVKPEYGGANYQNAIANFVATLNSQGLVAILDLHWSAPVGQKADGQDPMPNRDYSVEFWRQVATAYKNNSGVIFDLFNEPYPDYRGDASTYLSTTWLCWRDGGSACAGLSYQAAGMQELLDAVRGTGATNLVVVNGIHYANWLARWLEFKPFDPLGNLAAGWHVYNFNHCNNTSCYDNSVRPVAQQVPLVTSELGQNDCAHWFIDQVMNWLDAREQSYLGWTWNVWDCASGPALITSSDGTPTQTFGQGFKDHLAALAATSPTPTSTSNSPPTATPPPMATPGLTGAVDTYQRTIQSGWGTADSGGPWTVMGTPVNWSVTPGAGVVSLAANGMERAYLGAVNLQDVEIVQRVALPRCSTGSTCLAYVLARYNEPTYYRVGVGQGADRATMWLRAQRDDNTNLLPEVDTGLAAADGQVVWLRAQFQGQNPTAIRARAWLDGTAEPTTWQLVASDATAAQQRAGAVGVRARNEDPGAGHRWRWLRFQAGAPGTLAPPAGGATATRTPVATATPSSTATVTLIRTATGTPAGAPRAVVATGETQPVPHSGDAADDPAIWVHPTDPAQSTILGTDKQGGLGVYDLSGRQLQYLTDGAMNNVDLRAGFPLGGQAVALVTASNRTNNSLALYRVNPATRQLENVAARTISLGIQAYGLCMYRSASSGKYYVYINSNLGEVQQWELFATGSGRVDATQVRSFAVGSITEGCVADDELGHLYIAEEDVALWKYGAEPTAGTARTRVDHTGAGGRLVADIEGLAIAATGPGTGYLIASSQGNSTFVMYEREGNNGYVQSFQIVAGNGIDGVTETDGIDMTTASLGPAFPYGVFVAHDGLNDGANQNFKLVPWQHILPSAPAVPTPTSVATRTPATTATATRTPVSTVTATPPATSTPNPTAAPCTPPQAQRCQQ